MTPFARHGSARSTASEPARKVGPVADAWRPQTGPPLPGGADDRGRRDRSLRSLSSVPTDHAARHQPTPGLPTSHAPTRPLRSAPCPPPPVARSSSPRSTSWLTPDSSPSWPPTPRPPAGMASSSGITSSTARRRARCWTRGSRWPRSRWPPTRSSPGPMVTPLSRRRPHKLARETATLDLLSNGRLCSASGSAPTTTASWRRSATSPTRASKRSSSTTPWSSWRTTGAGRSCRARSSGRGSRSGPPHAGRRAARSAAPRASTASSPSTCPSPPRSPSWPARSQSSGRKRASAAPSTSPSPTRPAPTPRPGSPPARRGAWTASAPSRSSPTSGRAIANGP